ncbi:T9SS type A sorting domain-containing protein [Soonwooa purpurea]
MKKLYFVFTIFLVSLLYGQENPLSLQSLHQVNTYNGGSIFNTVFDDSGNSITVGQANGPSKIGDIDISTAKTDDLFILKTDNQLGDKIWLKTISPKNTGSLKAFHTISKNNNTYILCYLYGEIEINGNTYNSNNKNTLIIKLDILGNIIWANNIEYFRAADKFNDISIDNDKLFVLVKNQVFKLDDNTGELISKFYNKNLLVTAIEYKNQYLYLSGQAMNEETIGSETLTKDSGYILKANANFEAIASLQLVSEEADQIKNSIIHDLEFLSDGSLAFASTNTVKVKILGENNLIANCNYNMTQNANNLAVGRINADLTNVFWFSGNKILFGRHVFNTIKLFQSINAGFKLSYNPQPSSEIIFFHSSSTFNMSRALLLSIDANGNADNASIEHDFEKSNNIDFKILNNTSFFSEVSPVKTSVHNSPLANYYYSLNFDKSITGKKASILADNFKVVDDGNYVSSSVVKGSIPNFFGQSITAFNEAYTSQIFSKIDTNGNLIWKSGITGVYPSSVPRATISKNGSIATISTCEYLNSCYLYTDNYYTLLDDYRATTFMTVLNNNGKLKWLKKFKNGLSNYSIFEHKGEYYIIGSTDSSFVLDDVTYPNSSYRTVFIKIADDGTIKMVKFYDLDLIYDNVFFVFDQHDNYYLFLETRPLDENKPFEFGAVTIPQIPGQISQIMVKYSADGTEVFGKNFNIDLPEPYSTTLWFENVKSNGDDIFVNGVQGHDAANKVYADLNGQIFPIPEAVTHLPGYNSFVARIDNMGNLKWYQPIFADAILNGIANLYPDEHSNLYVSHSWLNQITVGNATLTSTPKDNLTYNIIKFNTSGGVEYNQPIFKTKRTIDTMYYSDYYGFPNLQKLNGDKLIISGNLISDNILTGSINNLNGDNYYIAILEEKELETAETYKKTPIIIYPNPTKDVINIKDNKDFTEVKIYDASAKLVLNQVLKNNQINVSELPKGVYYLELIGKEKAVVKFIKD